MKYAYNDYMLQFDLISELTKPDDYNSFVTELASFSQVDWKGM